MPLKMQGTERRLPQADSCTMIATETARSLEISVEGTTCAACLRRVKNGLRKLPTVVDTTVNLATWCARIQFNYPPANADTRAPSEAIRKTGLSAD
ncbi:MAG: heavy metal-associated domain-containing protein [Pirellulaceae bacterium]|nr:heavy metal-associated domain-containing protein [Pirellulaceae bacterium]